MVVYSSCLYKGRENISRKLSISCLEFTFYEPIEWVLDKQVWDLWAKLWQNVS